MFVQLHSLITKCMGETAAKLHLVFDAMVQTTRVYLFDEFDAIGSTRAGPNDVGEMRRIHSAPDIGCKARAGHSKNTLPPTRPNTPRIPCRQKVLIRRAMI